MLMMTIHDDDGVSFDRATHSDLQSSKYVDNHTIALGLTTSRLPARNTYNSLTEEQAQEQEQAFSSSPWVKHFHCRSKSLTTRQPSTVGCSITFGVPEEDHPI
jgi:hypothetical protein